MKLTVTHKLRHKNWDPIVNLPFVVTCSPVFYDMSGMAARPTTPQEAIQVRRNAGDTYHQNGMPQGFDTPYRYIFIQLQILCIYVQLKPVLCVFAVLAPSTRVVTSQPAQQNQNCSYSTKTSKDISAKAACTKAWPELAGPHAFI